MYALRGGGRLQIQNKNYWTDAHKKVNFLFRNKRTFTYHCTVSPAEEVTGRYSRNKWQRLHAYEKGK